MPASSRMEARQALQTSLIFFVIYLVAALAMRWVLPQVLAGESGLIRFLDAYPWIFLALAIGQAGVVVFRLSDYRRSKRDA